MTILLNGKSHITDEEDQTISKFLTTLPIGNQPVLVELNGEAILVREFEKHRIKDGDTVEVIRMVAGG